MSLAIMKKKYEAQKCLSTKKDGFSLKGTTRNIKNIGHSQVNSTVRTVFRGTEPKGYGALKPQSRRRCGTTKCSAYPISIICNKNEIGCSSVPTSTMTTKGLLLSKVYNPTQSGLSYLGQSGCNNDEKCRPWWVKTFNPLDHSQSMHVKKLKVRAIADAKAATICNEKLILEETLPTLKKESTCNDNTYMLGTRKISRLSIQKDLNSGAMPCSEYTDTRLLTSKCLPTPDCKAPFPFVLNKKFCQSYFSTPEEAIEAGFLPDDWMNCTNKYPITGIYNKNPYI